VSEPSGAAMELSGARVNVNGQYAPLVYASRERVDLVCPARPRNHARDFRGEHRGNRRSGDGNMADSAPGCSLSTAAEATGMSTWPAPLHSLQAATTALGQPAASGDAITVRATGIGSPDG